jgi:hypothetical protein
MPAIPESTKTSLAQRLRAHAKTIWFSGTTEEIFDLVCDLHVTNAGR